MVRDYMQTPVVTITPDKTIADAIRLMNQHSTNGLIVVGSGDKSADVLGVISSLDILERLVPDYLEEDKHLASFEPREIFVKRLKAIANDKVSVCMTSKKLYTVTPEDSLIEAAAILTEHRIHRLPVVDEKGKLVGYISRSDVKRSFSKILDSLEQSSDNK